MTIAFLIGTVDVVMLHLWRPQVQAQDSAICSANVMRKYAKAGTLQARWRSTEKPRTR